MDKHKKAKLPIPDLPGMTEDWRERIKADLAEQLERGGTLYGIRSDGAYVARTKDGERIIRQPDQATD